MTKTHHVRRVVLGICLCASLVLAADTPRAGAAVRTNAVHAFLQTAFSVTRDDIQRLDGGFVVARTLPVAAPRNAATFGIVRMAIPPAFYVAHLRDIRRFKKDDAILQVGAFANPPRLEDVAALTLDDSDLRSLRDCRIGDCGMQLPAATIERVQRIDWRRPDADQLATTAVRLMFVEYVAGYMQNGSSTAMRYADGRGETNVEQQFALLVPPAPIHWGAWSTLQQHLERYASADGAGASDSVYWSKEKIAGHGVATITHLAITRLPAGSMVEYAIGSKQLYSSHYYDASLGVTALVPTDASDAGMYLMYLNLSRIDMFEGAFGPIVRSVVKSKARSIVAAQLKRLQLSLEHEYRDGGAR